MALLQNYHEESSPWGSFERFTLEESSTVKLLRLLPQQRFSLQRHQFRSEYWQVLAGTGLACINQEERQVVVGDTLEIPKGAVHRLSAGPDGLLVLEIAFGTFDEDDIERLADDFNRV